MANENEGWQAVVQSAGLPSAILLFIAGVVKWPTFLRFLSREYKQVEAKKKDELEKEREEIGEWKDKELERLRAKESAQQQTIDKLLGRISQLMESILWWRDRARKLRHDFVSALIHHRWYEEQKGIPPLILADPPEIPRVAEESDADEYKF